MATQESDNNCIFCVQVNTVKFNTIGQLCFHIEELDLHIEPSETPTDMDTRDAHTRWQ